MEREEWKEKVLRCVRTYGSTTFANLMQELGAGAKGEYALLVPGCRNLYIWQGLSKELTDAVGDLHEAGAIRFCPVDTMVYALDGQVMHLPVSYEPKDHERPRWCPMAIEASDKSGKKESVAEC